MKILILTASPERDSIIDMMIAEELTKRGHKATLAPCLRAGRDAILQVKPDIVVMPPIMNPYARDMCRALKDWGVPVVIRNTEASISKKRYENLSLMQKHEIVGKWRHNADLVLVWSEEEAEIYNRDGHGQPAKAIGSLALDPYFLPDFDKKFVSKEKFCENCKISPKKKTILFASSWAFADAAPDLQVDEMREYAKNEKKRADWIEAIKKVHKAVGKKYNILLKLHPGEKISIYEKELPDDMTILTRIPSPPVLKNIDILIHSGSTLAVEAHYLNKPAFQFGKITDEDLYIYKVSPRCDTVEELIENIKNAPKETNADKKVLRKLVGRYGVIDGQATKRAVQLIENIIGMKIPDKWPKSDFNYEQPGVTKLPYQIRFFCSICKHHFFTDKNKKEVYCPWCSSRIFLNDETN